jgi:DNA polymerase-3 subunit epsilon
VDPREPIPPYVSQLTGIDDLLVAGEPPIEQVLPALTEFVRGTVFVAHNAGFDFGFVNAALERNDYPRCPAHPCARRSSRSAWCGRGPERAAADARALLPHARQPVHRALADAEATVEVLHGLLDLSGRLGIATLGDLHEACRARGRPHYGKIRLADHLPRAPGVYLFRGRDGRVLYVGQVEGSARAREVLLLRRRAQEGGGSARPGDGRSRASAARPSSRPSPSRPA